MDEYKRIVKAIGFLLVYIPLVVMFAYLMSLVLGVWGVLCTICAGLGLLLFLWAEN